MTDPRFFICNAKSLMQAFLHDSHIQHEGFFTFLVALAHGVAAASVNESALKLYLVSSIKYQPTSFCMNIAVCDST